MVITEGSTLPDYNTVGHYLLHSIMKHCTRHGLDYRPISEIALGMRQPQRDVCDALADLEAMGVVRVAELGMRLLVRCNCKVAKAKRGQPEPDDSTLVQPEVPVNVQVRDKFEEKSKNRSHGGLYLSRPSGLHPLDDCSSIAPSAWSYKDNLTSSDPTPGEWRGLPGVLKGTRLAKARATRADPNPDTGLGLAKYFQKKCWDADIGKGVQCNLPALAKQLNALKKTGVEPIQIRAMIDKFVVNPKWSRGKEPWLVFLKRRSHLLEATKTVRIQSEYEALRPVWVGKKYTYEELAAQNEEIRRNRAARG